MLPKDASTSPRSHKSMEKRISSHKPAGASISLCLGYSETTKLDRPMDTKKGFTGDQQGGAFKVAQAVSVGPALEALAQGSCPLGGLKGSLGGLSGTPGYLFRTLSPARPLWT